MYRDASKREDEVKPPDELVCDGLDRAGRRPPALALVQALSFPVVIAAALSTLVNPMTGLVGLVGTSAVGIWWWKKGAGSVLVLRVERGELLVTPRGTKTPKARFRIADIVNVVLDTKTIQRVEEGGSAIPAMRFIDSRVGADVDTSRIVIVPRDGASLSLTEAHVPHMDASEWLGKIRVFLRKHGWVPADEREPADEDDDDERQAADEDDSETESRGD